MSERTIDLDALAAELRTAGYRTGEHQAHYFGGVKLFAHSYLNTMIVYPDGRVQIGLHKLTDDQWSALAIIRRHVAPPVCTCTSDVPWHEFGCPLFDESTAAALEGQGVPDLHAKLLDIFNANTTSYGAGNATCSDFDGVAAADAILQLLGYPAVERPTRAATPAEEGEMPW